MNMKRRAPAEPDQDQLAGQEDAPDAFDELAGPVHGSSVQPTREQDAHPSAHGIDYETPWVPPQSLEAPEPRPGYVQRWVRTSTRGADDPGNVMMMLRSGWKPRPADSVPGLGQFPKLSKGEFSGFIGLHDLVLCEMPAKQAERIKAFYKAKSDRMMEGVTQELQGLSVRQMPITQERRSQVSRGGRRPIVAADPGKK